MSVELVVEVIKHAPPDLNSTERMLLVVIAESCNKDSRTTWYRDGWDEAELCRRVGIAQRSLSRVLTGLSKKGVEVRVPHKHAADGTPLFAFRGRQVTYRLPRFAPIESYADSRTNPATPEGKGTQTCAESYAETRSDQGESYAETRTLPLKDLPSKNTSPPPPAPDASDVVEGEVVKEGEEEASLEQKIKALVAEILAMPLRRSWRTKASEVAEEVRALVDIFGGSFEVAAAVARATAADPDTKVPARISNPGNPHFQDASSVMLYAKYAAAEDDGEPEPGTHPFESGGEVGTCKRCGMPERNERKHGRRRTNSGTTPTLSPRASIGPRNQHVPYFDPPDISAYKRSKI